MMRRLEASRVRSMPATPTRPCDSATDELIDLVWNRKIDPGKVFDLTLP